MKKFSMEERTVSSPIAVPSSTDSRKKIIKVEMKRVPPIASRVAIGRENGKLSPNVEQSLTKDMLKDIPEIRKAIFFWIAPPEKSGTNGKINKR